MKKINHFIVPLAIFMIPIVTYANCSDTELKQFEKVEDKYKIEYTIRKDTNTYRLILQNPYPDKYKYEVSGLNNWVACDENETGTKCDSVPPGSYSINIVGNTETCTSVLKRTFLKLKPYNKYSEDPLCKGIEEFVLCQETYEKEVDYETFVSRVNIYKEQKAADAKKNKKKIIDIDKIKAFVDDNLYEVIVVAAFIVLVIITIIVTIISVKKSRRLE